MSKRKRRPAACLALALAAVALFATCSDKLRLREGRLMEWNGAFAKHTAPAAVLIESNEQWKNLWNEEIGQMTPMSPDFSRTFAVAVFAGEKKSGGYAMLVHTPVMQDGRLVIAYQEIKPDPKDFLMHVRTTPYTVVLFWKNHTAVKLQQLPGKRR